MHTDRSANHRSRLTYIIRGALGYAISFSIAGATVAAACEIYAQVVSSRYSGALINVTPSQTAGYIMIVGAMTLAGCVGGLIFKGIHSSAWLRSTIGFCTGSLLGGAMVSYADSIAMLIIGFVIIGSAAGYAIAAFNGLWRGAVGGVGFILILVTPYLCPIVGAIFGGLIGSLPFPSGKDLTAKPMPMAPS